MELLDNSYRMTRFGFSADVAAVCSRNGIDAFEVIEAANHEYPRNSIPFPSIGVSGYCLTKDPYYLDSSGSEIWDKRGFPSTWIAARKAADEQMFESVELITRRLDSLPIEPVAVIAGITYKEDVDDCRLSHGREIAGLLRESGIATKYWDPNSREDVVDGISVERSESCLDDADCVIITVPHREFKEWGETLSRIDKMRTKFIFDGWGIVRSVPKGVHLIGTGKKIRPVSDLIGLVDD